MNVAASRQQSFFSSLAWTEQRIKELRSELIDRWIIHNLGYLVAQKILGDLEEIPMPDMEEAEFVFLSRVYYSLGSSREKLGVLCNALYDKEAECL